MRAVLGDRSLHTTWGGSVIDSVVGVFLTQNVSDVLSSMAFMALASTFPSKAYKRGLARRAAATHLPSCTTAGTHQQHQNQGNSCRNSSGGCPSAGNGGEGSGCSCDSCQGCAEPDILEVGADMVRFTCNFACVLPPAHVLPVHQCTASLV